MLFFSILGNFIFPSIEKMLQSLLPLRFSPFSRKLKSALDKGRPKVALFLHCTSYSTHCVILCSKDCSNTVTIIINITIIASPQKNDLA